MLYYEKKTNKCICRYVNLSHSKSRKAPYMFRSPYVVIFREELYAGYIRQYILQYIIHPSYNSSLKMVTKGDRNM